MTTTAAPPRPCLAAPALVHDHACTCLGARDGEAPRFPTRDPRSTP